MSIAPGNDDVDLDREAGKQADAMKDRLRKDVASWSAARSATSSRDAAETTLPPAAQPRVVQAAARAKRAKPAAPDAAKPADAAKKPFRMSYDGTTDKDYIAQRIKLGAR